VASPAFLAPFANRNYRLYFSGQLISITGTFVTFTALSWVVYELTQSPLMLGLFGLVGQLPTLVAGPLAGVWVDRFDRRRLLLVTQSLALLQSVTLAVLAFGHALNIPAVLGLSVAGGLVNAFDLPTRQAMVGQIAEKREDLPAVIGMNSTMFNLGRMIGPPIGGVLLSLFGAGTCFVVDAVSYLAVLAAIIAMRLRKRASSGASRPVLHDLKAGLRYALNNGTIRTILLLSCWVSVFGISFQTMSPAFARDVFRGDAHVLGWLMGASSLGAICGALRTASRTGIARLVQGLLIGATLLGLGMVVYASSRTLGWALPSMFICGMGAVTFFTSANALVQDIVDESMRGRVMSWYLLSFQAGFPIGGLIIGATATRLGVNLSVLLWGLLTGGAVLFLAFNRNRLLVRSVEGLLKTHPN
jgi:MFS family permease